MRSINDFGIDVDKALSYIIPNDMSDELTVGKVDVVKINDEKLHGLTFKRKDRDAAPTFYLENYYDDYRSGRKSAEEVAQEMFDMCMNPLMAAPPVDSRSFDFGFDSVKDKLSVRVIDPGRNREFLSDKPYVEVDGGLAAIMDINPSPEFRVTVNDGIFESMGVDKETLYSAALENMRMIDRPVLTDMQSALFGASDNLLDREGSLRPSEIGGMYVLTAGSGCGGAAYVADPDVMRKAAEVIGKSCYVLPSSLHEVILVPDNGTGRVSDFHDMVMQANRTVVMQCDILSDDVFYYDLHEHSFKNLTADMEHAAEEESDAMYDDDLDM